jgi:hypothetical protein
MCSAGTLDIIYEATRCRNPKDHSMNYYEIHEKKLTYAHGLNYSLRNFMLTCNSYNFVHEHRVHASSHDGNFNTVSCWLSNLPKTDKCFQQVGVRNTAKAFEKEWTSHRCIQPIEHLLILQKAMKC